MGTLYTNENITPQQAWDRGSPVYNLRIIRFADTSNPGGGSAGITFDIPPSISIQGIAVAPDSMIPNALVDWKPAGLPPPSAGIFPANHAWQAAGGRALVTREQPLLFPLTGRIQVNPYFQDLYGGQFTDLAGNPQNLSAAIETPDASQPMVGSFFLFLKPPPPSFQGGSRANIRSAQTAQLWPANAGGEQIIAIVPTQGRRSFRWYLKTTAAVPVDVRITAIEGATQVINAPAATDHREFAFNALGAGPFGGQIPANGDLIISGAIDTPFLCLRALSTAAAVNGIRLHELSDVR